MCKGLTFSIIFAIRVECIAQSHEVPAVALPATLKSASPMQWVRNMMSAYTRYLQCTQVAFSKGHYVYRWPHSKRCSDVTLANHSAVV